MEFGSKYVYSYTDSEEESVSEEEFETGIELTANTRYEWMSTFNQNGAVICY